LFGRLLVKSSARHLAKNALALHLLLEHTERLIDIVVADEDLQEYSLRGSRSDKNCRDMTVAAGLLSSWISFYAGQQIETRAPCQLRTDLLRSQASRSMTFLTMRPANANG